MQILGQFCLLISLRSVLEFYKKLWQILLGFTGMDCARTEIGCGVLVFECFSQVFNVLGLFLVFGLGFKVLQFGLHTKCLIKCLCEYGFCLGKGFDSKTMSCQCGSVKFLEDSRNGVDSGVGDEFDDEDKVFDVLSLRKLVKMERKKCSAALVELEKERMAAASAAEEAMAMILRLQSEKSSIEIESNQVRRLAEQKQKYDQEVIQSLLWIVKKQNSKQCMKLDDGDDGLNDLNSTIDDGDDDDGFHDLLISSLEFDELVD